MADLTTRTLGDTSKGAPLTNEEVDQNFINLRDDPRNSDSREWTGVTVSQAEAEAGSGTTRRAWTAQRVKQAITSAVSTLQAKLNGIEANATKNATDAQLRARGSHTGTQDVSTIVGLADAATTSVSSIQSGTSKADVGLPNVRNVSSYSQDEANNLLNGKVSEAPEDGAHYVRSDGNWSEAPKGYLPLFEKKLFGGL